MPAPPAGIAPSLFAVGRNCCALARADRVALLVDGEDYFRAFARAAEQARHFIGILAWDFNSNTLLDFEPARGGRGQAPSRLGDFLNWLVRRRRDLHIYILDWDYPMVYGTDRELPPVYGVGWRPHRRVKLAYDNTHPLTGSHHQKIIVIDDVLAFIGGFDLTVRRWDTCAHRADDARRECDGKPYPPFHDIMMAMSGAAARELGGIVRSRWKAATRHSLPAPVIPERALWPAGLEHDFENVDVALARTLPPVGSYPGVVEVETLYLDMIAAATRNIYIENQYFTAYRIGDALEARLAEPDGPEIVVIVRLFSHGWLEEHTMHILRSRLVQRLRAADRHGHFHIYYAHVEGLAEGLCIDLHSKLMIVDDEILRVGSANLCNRSMGMDTECDAVIEARGDTRVAATIRDFRNRLLGEHLDVATAVVDEAVRQHGSLHGAIDALAGRDRTLRALEDQPDWPEAVIELASVGDPGQPVSLESLIEGFNVEQLADGDDPDGNGAAGGPRSLHRLHTPARRILFRLGGFITVLLLLAAVWRYTPLAQWVDAERVTQWAREFSSRPWAPLLILVAYTPACVVMFPRPLITLAAVVAFGPVLGFIYSLTGILLAALLTYVAGMYLPPHMVRSMAGTRLRRVTDTLRRRGLLAVTALRLVPLAPFAVEGVVAAAIGIPLSTFMLGTLIGMLPGTIATTVFGDQLEAALHDPSQIDYGLLAAAATAILALSLMVRRWLVAQHRPAPDGNADARPR